MAGPNVSDVQKTSGNGASLVLPAFAVNAVAGDTIVVGYGHYNFGAGVALAPTDNRGNVYVQLGTTKVLGQAGTSMWVATNVAAGATTVTARPNGTFAAAVAWLVTNTLAGSYNLDWVGATGNATAVSPGTTTLTPPANSLFLCVGSIAAAVVLGDVVGWNIEGANGFTAAMHARANNPDWTANYDLFSSYKIASAAQTPVFTTSGGGNFWAAMCASFAINPIPTPTSVSPGIGQTVGGDAVVITGTGFITGATVDFGGAAATSVVVVSDTTINCVSPAHAAGTAVITVSQNGFSGSLLASQWTYAVKPMPTTIVPQYMVIGTPAACTIRGSGFLNGATVTFDGVPATSVVVVNSTTITCIAPTHAVGNAVVTVTNP